MSYNNDFDKDPRRQQELKMRPVADRVYRYVFDNDIEINRFESGDSHLLDKFFAIDVQIKLPTGNILTGQEKFLSFEYARFNSLTVEYWQNQHTEEEGDWFNLAPQFYFCGYCNREVTQFVKLVIVNWPALALATYRGLEWHHNVNNGRARASFRYINFDDIPNECVIFSYSKKEPA